MLCTSTLLWCDTLMWFFALFFRWVPCVCLISTVARCLQVFPGTSRYPRYLQIPASLWRWGCSVGVDNLQTILSDKVVSGQHGRWIQDDLINILNDRLPWQLKSVPDSSLIIPPQMLVGWLNKEDSFVQSDYCSSSLRILEVVECRRGHTY